MAAKPGNTRKRAVPAARRASMSVNDTESASRPDPSGAAERSLPINNEAKPPIASQLDTLLGLAGSTSRIVQQAASILEEEIAIGIVAARGVEEHFVDVGKLRSGNSEEVMQRFRRDAHDVVDILVDLVNLATNSLTGLAQRAIKISGGAIGAQAQPGASAKSAAGAIPSLIVSQTVKPGSSVEVPMTLENDSDSATETFQFVCSDLLNADGARIAADQISFAPASLVIGPRTSASVAVTVMVPEGTDAGVYSGLLQATKLNQLRAVLTISIL